MTRALAIYAKQFDCVFTVNGEVEPAVFLFSPECFLPVIAMHADMNAQSLLGRPLGISFNNDEQALLGLSVDVSPLTGDEISVLRAVFFAHAMHQIFGLSQGIRQVECLPVFEAYQQGLFQHINQNEGMRWPIAAVLPR